MILKIDTSTNEYIYLALLKGDELIDEAKVESKYKQSELLLVSISDILKKNKIDKKDLEKILVNDEGEGFSALRIGVVAANSLAYGLGIDVFNFAGESINIDHFKIVKPRYKQEPNIG